MSRSVKGKHSCASLKISSRVGKTLILAMSSLSLSCPKVKAQLAQVSICYWYRELCLRSLGTTISRGYADLTAFIRGLIGREVSSFRRLPARAIIE